MEKTADIFYNDKIYIGVNTIPIVRHIYFDGSDVEQSYLKALSGFEKVPVIGSHNFKNTQDVTGLWTIQYRCQCKRKEKHTINHCENVVRVAVPKSTALTASQFKHPVPDEAGLYSRKQLEDAHIVGYRKGRLADKDSDSVYQDAKNYAATIHPSQPEGDGKSTDWHLGNIARVKEMAEIQSNLNDFKEECERLAGLVKFWQDKYYEAVPNIMPGKIDNNPIA